jgi:hypothetical protein
MSITMNCATNEIEQRTLETELQVKRESDGRVESLDLPQMTKSNLPNLSIQAFAAAFKSSGLRTSAWTGRQVRPVSVDSCWAALAFSVPLSTRK